MSLANKKESFTGNSFIIKKLSIGTKKIVILYVDVPIADNAALKGGQTSTIVY